MDLTTIALLVTVIGLPIAILGFSYTRRTTQIAGGDRAKAAAIVACYPQDLDLDMI